MVTLDEKKLNAIGRDFKKCKKLLCYMNRVFHFKDLVNNQKDYRKKRHIENRVIFTILFFAFLFRVKSFNQLEQMIKYGCFKPLFSRSTKMPSIDTISDTLTLWDIEQLQNSFQRIIEVLYNKKTFKNGTIDGYTVCAIDGTDSIKSSKKKCKGCALMKNKDGYYYVHKAIVAMIIGEEANYVLNYGLTRVKSEKTIIHDKTYKDIVLTKAEGELTVAHDLLDRLPSWVDVIVGDALYLNAPFVKQILKHKKHAVIRLKDKTTSAYKTLEHHVMYNVAEDSFKVNESYSEIVVSYWQRDTFITDSALLKKDPEKHVDIRLYKFVEVIETKIKGKTKYSFNEIYVGTTDKNMSPQTVWRIIHKRWYIENTCFHQLKTYCSMKHCFRHDDVAIEAILIIMFMAFNIIQSYLFKRAKKFKEDFNKKKATISWFITELEYEFVVLSKLMKYKIIDCEFLCSS